MATIIFDTETTGVEPGSRLVELHACLLDEDGDIPAEFSSLVNPGMAIPPDCTVHGLSDQDLAAAPPAAEVLAQWLEWIAAHDVDTAIAHFASYDVGIISWELGRAEMPLPEDLQVIDTCAMAKAIKATKRNSLPALVEHYGIERQGAAHRAQSDCLAVADYWDIAKDLTDHNPVPWKPEYRFPSAFPDHLAGMPEAVESGLPWRFSYVDARGARSDRTVIPYGYAEDDRGVFFHGRCLLREARRTFVGSRVAKQ